MIRTNLILILMGVGYVGFLKVLRVHLTSIYPLEMQEKKLFVCLASL